MSNFYHHCMPFGAISHGILTPHEKYSVDPFFKGAYEWLSQQVGFWPLFLSVGDNKDAHYMTGYQDNWRVFIGGEIKGNVYHKIYRKKGEFPNMVMFSFEHVDGVFTDYMAWHYVLSAYGNVPKSELKNWEIKQIFKSSWGKSKWLRHACKNNGEVQLIAPYLDLRTATRIWVRNKSTKQALESMGFNNVYTKRIKGI